MDRLLLHGPVLASLFKEANSRPDGFDGILFGQVHARMTQMHSDHEEAQYSSDRVGLVNGALCSPSLGSFFSAAGDINHAMLHNLLKKAPNKDPVLGCVLFRPGPATEPSMKDVAVAYSLAGTLASSMGNHVPVHHILCLLNVDKDHQDATLSFGYRVYQLATSTPNDSPLPLGKLPTEVVNLGGNNAGQRYGNFWPVSHVADSHTSVVNGAIAVRTLSSIGLGSQIAQMEHTYQEALSELNALVKISQREKQRLDALRSEVAKWRTK